MTTAVSRNAQKRAVARAGTPIGHYVELSMAFAKPFSRARKRTPTVHAQHATGGDAALPISRPRRPFPGPPAPPNTWRG